MAKKIADTAAFKTQLGGIGSAGGGDGTANGENPLADFMFEKAQELVKELTGNLKKSGANATSNLMQSIEPRITVQGTSYNFKLLMADYWEFVDGGRGKTKKKGDKPLWEHIAKWITDKGIEVKMTNAKGEPKKFKDGKAKNIMECREDMAKGIAHHIHQNGTKGNKFFSKLVNKQWEQEFIKDVQKAWKQQVLVEIDNALSNKK